MQIPTTDVTVIDTETAVRILKEAGEILGSNAGGCL
jgi:hypothetical protein